MKRFIIYRVWCRTNRKFYIGRTTTDLKKRWGVHKSHAKHAERYSKHGKRIGHTRLCRAIRKHGIENFEIRQIDEARDFAHMVWLEYFYIQYYNALDPRYGYNLITDKYGDEPRKANPEVTARACKANHLRYGAAGVTWDKSREKWCLGFICGKTHVVKRFEGKEDAQSARDRLSLLYYGPDAPLHFPERRSSYLAEDLTALCAQLTEKRAAKTRFKGVAAQQGAYHARVAFKGKRIYLGRYDTDVSAAIVHDKVTVLLGLDDELLNFPELKTDSYVEEGRKIHDAFTDPRRKQIRRKGKSSSFNGVSRRSPNTWEMTLTRGGSENRIRETHPTEEAAALAHDYHVRQMELDTNLLNFPDRFVGIKPVALPTDRTLKKTDRQALLVTLPRTA